MTDVPDPQPTLAWETLVRATDLLRAFAMHPEHPDYKQKMLEIKGLLETTERILRGQAAQHSTAAPVALEEMRARKDAAYTERNQVVAALAKLFPSGTKRTDIPGWSEDWHGAVYIDLPTGQISWHYHDSQAPLFADLPPYQGEWDGHTTEVKYERLAALQTAAPVAGDARARANAIYDAALVDGTRGRSKLMAEQDIASITPHIEQAIIYGIAAALTAADRARGDG